MTLATSRRLGCRNNRFHHYKVKYNSIFLWSGEAIKLSNQATNQFEDCTLTDLGCVKSVTQSLDLGKVCFQLRCALYHVYQGVWKPFIKDLIIPWKKVRPKSIKGMRHSKALALWVLTICYMVQGFLQFTSCRQHCHQLCVGMEIPYQY